MYVTPRPSASSAGHRWGSCGVMYSRLRFVFIVHARTHESPRRASPGLNYDGILRSVAARFFFSAGAEWPERTQWSSCI